MIASLTTAMRRGRPQTALVRICGEDHEGDDERQIRHPAVALHPHRGEHHLDADELKGDVRHRRENARDGGSPGERRALKAAAHEVGGGDVPVPLRYAPQAGHHDEDERIRDDRVGNREEIRAPRHQTRVPGRP